MKYRPEIDGLRTIAVLAVVLYHAQIIVCQKEIFAGGFIGVDVFFVISGYLISSILLREMEDHKFSLKKFYERRARRILPALFLVIFFSVPLFWKYMLPNAFKEYTGSILSTALFGSNIYFGLGDSYDAEVSSLKPLLHTWSLSIEEQFYILFPLLLFVAHKYFKKQIHRLFLAGIIVSLAFAHWCSLAYPDMAFFMLPSRAWELLAGALIAVTSLRYQKKRNDFFDKLCPSIGLVLVLVSIFTFSDKMRHPSLITAIPVLGVMLIILFSGKKEIITKFLSTRLMVGIGLISYSLYLWHQILFVFFRVKSAESLSYSEILICIILSFVLAVFSYFFVEQPFRKPGKISSKFVWNFSFLGIFVLVAIGGYGYFNDGLPQRLPIAFHTIKNATKAHGTKMRKDGISCGNFRIDKKYCTFSFNNPKTTWITVGDSHIRTLHKPLLEEFEDCNVKFIMLTSARCVYVKGLERISKNGVIKCSSKLNDQRAKVISKEKKPVVIMGGRLQLLTESKRFNNKEGGVERGNDKPRLVELGKKWSQPASVKVLGEKFKKTVTDLISKNVRVILVYPIPEVGWHVPGKLAKLASGNLVDLEDNLKKHPITTSYDVFRKRCAKAYKIYNSIPDNPLLLRIYPEEVFCAKRFDGRCVTHDLKNIYYRDDDHLSLAGGRLLVAKILKDAQNKWGRGVLY